MVGAGGCCEAPEPGTGFDMGGCEVVEDGSTVDKGALSVSGEARKLISAIIGHVRTPGMGQETG